MKKNLIRVFVNEKNIIELSPYASLYSLKYEINKKIYDNIPFDNIILHFKGKSIIDDNKSLISYGIDNDSNLVANVKTNGGFDTSNVLMIIIYILLVPIYFIFLASGVMPLFANIFSFIFDNTVLELLKYFGKNLEKDGIFFRYSIKFIMWVITTFSTFIFVWATASYVIFPFYYLIRGKRYCESGLKAKHVGKITAIWYMLIYGSYNIYDFLLTKEESLVKYLPDILILKGTLNSSILATKEAWDIAKFAPLYAIPFIGEPFMIIHEYLEEGLGLLYESLDMISQYNCDDVNSADLLCSFFDTLYKTLEKYNVKNDNGKISNKLENNNKKKITTSVNKIKSKKNEGLEEKEIAGLFIEPIKNYKLGFLIKLLKRGFCDKALKNEYKDKNKNLTENQLQNSLPELKGTEFDNTTIKGMINRWWAGSVSSLFCQILEALQDITNILWNVGTENEILNMIKTGQIAGIISIIVFIIDTLLNF